MFVSDSPYWDLTGVSRASTQRIRLPRVLDGPSQWLGKINEVIVNHDIDVWIPTCEETFYAAYFNKEAACRVTVDSIDTLDSLHNKWEFTKLADVAGTRAPETLPLWNDVDVEPFLANSADWVFKPMYSRFAAQTLIGPTSNELVQIKPSKERGWVAQRKIDGRELCTFSICFEGRVQAHVCYESKYRAGKGAGIYLVPQEYLRPTEYAAALVEKVGFTGMLGLDIIQDEAGAIWPIEANPRATSGSHLIDYDNDILDAFLGDCTEPLGTHGQARMVGFAMPTWGLADAWRKRKLRQFFIDIFRARDVLWRWTDPLPSFMVLPAMAEFAVVAWKRKLSLHDATTWDFEWNGKPE